MGLILIVLLVVLLLGGFGGRLAYPENPAYWGGSGIGLVLIVLLILYLLGVLPRIR